MAGTSSVNCLSCRFRPYQCLHSLDAWTPFSGKALFFTDAFVASLSPNSVSKEGPEFFDTPNCFWETDFNPVRVLTAERDCALPMRLPNPSPILDKLVRPWVKKFYPVLGPGSGRRLLCHFAFPDSSSALDKFQSATQKV